MATLVPRGLKGNGMPGAVAGLVTGGNEVGEAVVESQDICLGKFCERPLGCLTN